MLSLAFATIAVVGTVLAAVHDLIAVMVRRRLATIETAGTHADRRPRTVTSVMPIMARAPARTTGTARTPLVHAVRVSGATSAATEGLRS